MENQAPEISQKKLIYIVVSVIIGLTILAGIGGFIFVAWVSNKSLL